MHSRSHITIACCILTMPGRSTSGFHRPRRHRVHQAAKRARGDVIRVGVGIGIGVGVVGVSVGVRVGTGVGVGVAVFQVC